MQETDLATLIHLFLLISGPQRRLQGRGAPPGGSLGTSLRRQGCRGRHSARSHASLRHRRSRRCAGDESQLPFLKE